MLGGSVLETRRRSIAKALSWRVAATLITAAVTWIVTGRIDTAIEVGLLDTTVKLFAFYGHERLWVRLPYGHARPPDYRI